jgi:hypothetical protein
MNEYGPTPSFLETPQQDLRYLLSHSGELDASLQYALDRSCTPHCIEAIAELHGLQLPSLDRLQGYVAFLQENGAHPEKGSSNKNTYLVDDGWYNIAIADLLRSNGFAVVSQNLAFDAQASDLAAARRIGRIRSDHEQEILERRTAYGGKDRERWLGTIQDTIADGGYALVSIVIPSSKEENANGRHSIVVTAIGPDEVTYFDPDKLAIARYGQDASAQHIRHQQDGKLLYTQDVPRFTDRMAGEVMHIFPPAR